MRREAGLGVKLELHRIATCAVRTIRFTEVSEDTHAYPILRRASAK
jgi:hypothetical protein